MSNTFRVRCPEGPEAPFLIEDLQVVVFAGLANIKNLLLEVDEESLSKSTSLYHAIQGGKLVRVDGEDADIDPTEAFDDVAVLTNDSFRWNMVLSQRVLPEQESYLQCMERFGTGWSMWRTCFDNTPPPEVDAALSSNWEIDLKTNEVKPVDPESPCVVVLMQKELAGAPRYVGVTLGLAGGIEGSTHTVEVSLDDGNEYNAVTPDTKTATKGWTSTKGLRIKITLNGPYALRFVGFVSNKRIS